ncbi:hypothetical protein EV121DRAFT_297616, partial [Schizophyllum commune]
MATRQLRTRIVTAEAPIPRPRAGARKHKAGTSPPEAPEAGLVVSAEAQAPAARQASAGRRTKRGKPPVSALDIEQDHCGAACEASLEPAAEPRRGGEAQVDSVAQTDNIVEPQILQSSSHDTRPSPRENPPTPPTPTLPSKRNYLRARPRKRGEPRPINEDAYFIRRPNFDVPHDSELQPQPGGEVSPSHAEDDVVRTGSYHLSSHDEHLPLDSGSSPVVADSTHAVADPHAWDALEDAARLGKGMVVAEDALRQVLGERYDYTEWQAALQAVDGYDPDDTFEDCVQHVLRLKDSALERAGEPLSSTAAPPPPVTTSRASRQRAVPRCAQGVQLKDRRPVNSEDDDLEDEDQDDSSDL